MTQIRFAFKAYPLRKSKKVVELTDGWVHVELHETPPLPTQDRNYNSRNGVAMKEKLMQRSYRWGFCGDIPDDLQRFVRGKYWHRVQTLLVAEFLRERELPHLAAVFERLGQGSEITS